MKIIGITHDVLICSACIMVDGEIIAAIAEERLDRVKQSRVFPRLALEKCLSIAGLTMDDIDEIAIAWNPIIDLETIPTGYLQNRRWRTEHLMQVPGQILKQSGNTASLHSTIHNIYDNCPPITYVSHYWSHMGNGYLQSPSDTSAIIVLDGRGEKHTVIQAIGTGTDIEVISETFFPHSLGLFYSTITQFLGHRPDSDEWKVMALASYCDSKNKYYSILREMISVDDKGQLLLDLTYFDFYNYSSSLMFSPRLIEILGPPRVPNSDYSDRDKQIASALQQVFEDVVTKMLCDLHKKTGLDDVVVTGGCFMNSVFNGKISELTPFKNCHITFCPDDSGTSLGAAAWLYSQRTGKRPSPLKHGYLGSSFTQKYINKVTENFKLPNAEVLDDPTDQAAKDIADGKIIGWFQGKSEFGQRALGNRSILADPRRAEMKDKINAAVKFREGYRPFAPAILSDQVNEYFECSEGSTVPYMERVFMFKDKVQEKVPAVVHIDGSGRLQTVNKETNHLFHELISKFESITGIPIIINTSFNLNGEPVVDSPEDAIRTFYSCGLDVLYIGNTRISKL
jgi:carbamoyltransferase